MTDDNAAVAVFRSAFPTAMGSLGGSPGRYKFLRWYDYESWYPLGRPIGTTSAAQLNRTTQSHTWGLGLMAAHPEDLSRHAGASETPGDVRGVFWLLQFGDASTGHRSSYLGGLGLRNFMEFLSVTKVMKGKDWWQLHRINMKKLDICQVDPILQNHQMVQSSGNFKRAVR